MNEIDVVDVITIVFIALPVIVISFFVRSYMKTTNEIQQYSKHLASHLALDEQFVVENSKDSSLLLKIIIAYALMGAFAFQIYEINPLYVYMIPVISMVVIFGLYGRSSGIDENDAAFIVIRILSKISEANRIGNLEKAKKLSLIADYTIAKFELNKTGDVFVSQKHISFVDTLSGNERTGYIAKNLITKLFFSIKVLLPIVIMVVVSVLLKAAF